MQLFAINKSDPTNPVLSPYTHYQAASKGRFDKKIIKSLSG